MYAVCSQLAKRSTPPLLNPPPPPPVDDDLIVVVQDDPPVDTEPPRLPIPGSVHCTSTMQSVASTNQEQDNAVDSLSLDDFDLMVGMNSLALSQCTTYNFQQLVCTETGAVSGTGESALANRDLQGTSEAVTCTLGGTKYVLAHSFAIQDDESFSGLDPCMYPKHLPGMARILYRLRSAGCPLDVLDDVMKIIEGEVRAGHFQASALPRSQSSLLKILKLFPVPKPVCHSVAYEKTAKQKKDNVQPTTTSFPVFDFYTQLHDLLEAEEFMHLDNLSVNSTN